MRLTSSTLQGDKSLSENFQRGHITAAGAVQLPMWGGSLGTEFLEACAGSVIGLLIVDCLKATILPLLTQEGASHSETHQCAEKAWAVHAWPEQPGWESCTSHQWPLPA